DSDKKNGDEKEARLRSPGRAPGRLEAVSYRLDEDDTPSKAKKEDKRPGSEAHPIEIVAIGNRLVIRSEDERAIALVQQMINLFLKAPGKGDYTIIPLKNANATEAAKALDEAFNGTTQQKAPQQPQSPFGGGGFFGRFGAQ